MTPSAAASSFARFDPYRVPSPCFVIDKAALEANLAVLADVQSRGGARVLAALKAFASRELAPLVMRHLAGTCASGLHEARFGHEAYGGEVHVFSAGFTEADLAAVLEIADHVVFNSVSQWTRFRPLCLAARERRPALRFGWRVNPEHSEGTTPIYDPCAPGSRLGITAADFDADRLDGISGLHFHTLCEQGLAPLERTVAAFEKRFGAHLARLDWVNFGGGHHVTAPGYDVEGLIRLVRDFAARHDVQVYLEPGEAVVLGTGVLVTEVLDVADTPWRQTILDTSATCHMPDVLEMPYRPTVIGAVESEGEAPAGAHVHRLGGMTCLAGDVIGDYAFPAPLKVGERVVFDDMTHYTMVKTTTFNGIALPAIALWDSRNDALGVVRRFGYEDFAGRLP